MLPTILFVLLAYGLYGLLMWWCRWQRTHLWAKRHHGKPRWQCQALSALVLTIFLGALLWLTPRSKDSELKLAGILGLSTESPKATETVPEPLAAKARELTGPMGEPSYVLLHPAAPPYLGPPGSPAGTPLARKPKALAVRKRGVLADKGQPGPPKRDKASSPSKSNALKKRNLQTSTRNSHRQAI